MLFRPARASDMDEICTLLATAKQAPWYFHTLFTADPAFDPALIRVAWTGGHIIACAKIYPRALRIGTTVVPVAGIGNVRTDPRHWRKGLATALLGECLTAMYLEGALLAPLWATRQDLFARRGWRAVAEVWLEIPVQALKGAGGETAARVRLFEGRDLDAVRALHESVNTARTGSVVRERDDWLWLLTVLDLQGATLLVAERAGEIVGYVAAQSRNQSSEVLEMLLAPGLRQPRGPDRPSAAEDVMLCLLRAALAVDAGAAMVCAGLPADYRHLICHALAPYVAATKRDDLMLRVVDPVRLLHQLVPLLAARLADSPGGEPLAVRIGPLRGGAVLRVARHGVAVERSHRDDEHVLPDATFVALLLGTESACAQLDALPLPTAMRQTLRRLFPPQDSVVWRSDAF